MKQGIKVAGLMVLCLAVPAVDASQRVAQIEGTIAPEELRRHRVLVDPASQLQVRPLDWGGSEPDKPWAGTPMITLSDPTGRRIPLANPPEDPAIRLVEETRSFKGKQMESEPAYYLAIDHPAAGPWIVEVDAADLTAAARYQVSVALEGAAYELSFPESEVERSVPTWHSFLIEVRLRKDGEPYSQARVTASMLLMFTGDQYELMLRDDGTEGDRTPNDGTYSAPFTLQESGEYLCEVSATDGQTFEREAVKLVRAVSNGARLTGEVKEEPVDEDRDGNPEGLSVIAGVEVLNANGSYRVQGVLSSPSGYLIGLLPPSGEPVQVILPSISALVTATAGVHEVALIFPGEWFLKSRQDGPYVLSLELEEVANPGFSIDSLKPTYRTQPYRWQQFESDKDASVPARH